MIGLDCKSTTLVRAFFASAKRYLTLMGGTESSKTFGALVALWLILSTTPAKGVKRPIVSCVALTSDHLERGMVRDWEMITAGRPEVSLKTKRPRIYEVNGWTIEFFSLDKPGKAHGPRREHLLIDEINYVPEEVCKQLMQRTNGKVVVTFNPSAKFWWRKFHIVNRLRAAWFRLTWRDNPYASQATIDDILSWKESDPLRYQIYGEGEWGQIEGLVHPRIHISKYPSRELLQWETLGIDYGFTGDPTVLVKVAHSEGRLYLKEYFRKATADPREVSEGIRHTGWRGPIWADNAPVMNAELVRRGHDVRKAPKPAGSVESGIAVMNGYELHIDPDSKDLIRDFETYSRRKVGDEYKEPLHRGSDGCDASRYGLVGHTQPQLKKQKAGRLLTWKA